MSKQMYNKLVRDKIPEIIEADGKKPKTRILDKDAYLQALISKLEEETEEFKKDQNIEELADLQEVILALADALDITPGELASAFADKAQAKGRFKKRIFLEEVS